VPFSKRVPEKRPTLPAQPTFDSVSDTAEEEFISPRKQEFLRVFRQIDIKTLSERPNKVARSKMQVKLKQIMNDSIRNSAEHFVENNNLI
jgi:hypothetical protein